MFRRTTRARLLTTAFHLFIISLLAASHAATTPEEYWHLVLPNTPIPNVIRDILYTDGKQNFHVDNGGYREQFFDTFTSYGEGPPGKACDHVLHYDPSIIFYFMEEDLFRPGAKMNFLFPKSNYGITFLSRQDADSLPFSSSKLPEIFSRFSIEPKSPLSKYLRNTLTKCELPDAYGETKFCATSLESMVDFTTSSLGTNQVQALSTFVVGERDEKEPELFSITGTRRLDGDKLVSCHEEVYPYAVFYCHTSPARAYVAELVGEHSTRVEAAVACHTDTKGWSPEHLAFEMLRVKPGQATICHFLPRSDLIFRRSI